MTIKKILKDPRFKDAVDKIITAEKHANEKGLYETQGQDS